MTYIRRAKLETVLLVVAAATLVGTCSVANAQIGIHSSRAIGAKIIFVDPQPSVLVFCDSGQLPPNGGELRATLDTIRVAGTLSSHTVSSGCDGYLDGVVADSWAVQYDVIVFEGQPAQVTAVTAGSRADVGCGSSEGFSTVTDLTFGGAPVTVTMEPNQTVSIPGVATLVINEFLQVPGGGDLTVNALHLTLVTGEEVIVSSAHGQVNCATPSRPSTWGMVKRLFH